MKKKLLNITLITIMLFIYGSIFKKCSNSNKINSHNKIENTVNNVVYNINKDTFSLILTNKNPFTISKPNNSKPVVKTTNPNNKNKLKLKSFVSWPKIKYYGFVKSETQITKLSLLQIDNKLIKIRENEIVEDIKIVKAYSDSIILSLNNSKKTFLK